MRRALLRFAAVSVVLLASVGALLAVATSPARGAVSLPEGFNHSRVVGGLEDPTDMGFAPDGRLFVAEQAGKLRVLKANGNLATFLDISGKVDAEGERGLLAVAFDPDFRTNRFVYLHYTRKATAATPVHNRVVRVTVNRSGTGVVTDSERLIFRLDDQGAPLHQGGAIDFGEDGKLYVATGDNAAPENARKLTNLFGKVLRINKDGTVPSDNPFYSSATGANRAIWALGLRNPFKFAARRGTDAVFINDVGEDRWEEINRGIPGADYGWPAHEGPESDPDHTPPLFAYGHGGERATSGCAITGGAFYEPTTVRFPRRYVGDYFFADLCNGWIRSYDPATDNASGFASGLGSIVDLEVSRDGQLYLLSRGEPGSVAKIRYTGN